MGQDMVHQPKHYTYSKFQPKDVNRDNELNFNMGSAVKYISRAGMKDDVVQELNKANEFIQFEIDYLKSTNARIYEKIFSYDDVRDKRLNYTISEVVECWNLPDELCNAIYHIFATNRLIVVVDMIDSLRKAQGYIREAISKIQVMRDVLHEIDHLSEMEVKELCRDIPKFELKAAFGMLSKKEYTFYRTMVQSISMEKHRVDTIHHIHGLLNDTLND